MGFTILAGLIGLSITIAAFFSLQFGFYFSVILGFSAPILERFMDSNLIDFDTVLDNLKAKLVMPNFSAIYPPAISIPIAPETKMPAATIKLSSIFWGSEKTNL